MKNLKIGKKLFLTFAIILLLFVITVAAAFNGLNSVSDSYTYFSGTMFKVNDRVTHMRRDIQASAKFIMYAITSPDKAESYIEEAQTCLDSLTDGVDFLYANSTAERSIIDGLERNLASSASQKEQIFSLILEKNNTKALELYFNEYYPLLAKANEYLLQISDYTAQTAESAYQEAQAEIHLTFIVMGIIAVIIFIVTAVLGLYITRNLKKPIREIERAAESLSRGELSDTMLSYQSKDELGMLAESMRRTVATLSSIIGDIAYLMKEMAGGNFNIRTRHEDSYQGDFLPVLQSIREMNIHFSETMQQINQSADQVASGSEQVSTSAQALSQSSTEQASSVEHLAGTVDAISERVSHNADNAREASIVAGNMGQEMQACNEKMQDMIRAMDEISSSSSEIGKIIKAIEDIAFQTNILALNAAVEAARAGEAGRGFAVVADEVRQLAGKSAEASQNTSSLIESSIRAVENGTNIADETASSLMTVVEEAKTMTAAIQKIAEASHEQADSISQVTEGIDQISAVVQTNSASAEESAAASEELSGQAHILKELVGHFVLRDTERPAVNPKDRKPALLTDKQYEPSANYQKY